MNLMGSWPSVSDHIFYLSKLWINENFPKGIISRSLKEQKATPVIILMLSTPMESKVFLLQSLFSPRPHHHKMSCAFRHFPIEIKIGGTRSSELCWDHQPLTSATKKKKGKVKARNPRKEWINKKSLLIFTAPKYPFANRKDSQVITCFRI